MANVPRDIKISEFVSKASGDLTSSAYFTFVLNGTNYRIPFSELLSAVGTTGSLEQTGDATGIPVLQKVALVNYLRNVIGKSGILASLSAENGIQLDHNFTADETGVPILKDTTSVSPVIRSLTAGAGMAVAASNGNIQISYTGELPASNVVIVNTMEDFPAADAGVRTLSDNTAYLVSANLTTADRFVLGDNCLVYGADSSVASLTYTGVGTMFTGVNNNSKITLLTLKASTGQLFAISGSTSVFQLVNVTIEAVATLGTVADAVASQVTDCAINSITSDGVTFSGTPGTFVGTRNLFTISAGTVFDLDSAVFQSGFSLETSTINLGAGTFFLDGLADSGNISADGLGSVLNCRFLGAGTPLNTITAREARWAFYVNDEIPDSTTSILARRDTGTATIAAISTPIKVDNADSTTWTYTEESQFSGDTTGRFTYEGKGAHININGNVSAVGIVPSSRDYEFLLYKNGTQITGATFPRSFNNSSSGSVAVTWQEELVTGDYLELWVQNTESTDDLEILSVTLGFNS